MKNFKLMLAKNLIFLLIVLIIASLFGLGLANKARAAYGLDVKIKQVKTAANPLVYYLDHKRGLKKAYVSPAAYLSYGNKWSDIKIISQEELNKWPDLHLVKAKNSNQVYYLNNGQKALINSEQQFIDYGFNWSDIAVLFEVDLNEYKLSTFDNIKAVLSDGEADARAKIQGGLVKISSAPLNLTSLYLPTGSRGNVLAVFRFEAVGRNVKITNLTFTQQGVASDNIIDAAYLVDEAGIIYGDRYGLTNKRLYLNLAGQPLVIPAGENKTFYLKADLKPVSGAAGQTLKFGILNAVDVAADARVAGAFPALGQEFRLADGVNNLGKVRITSVILNKEVEKVSLGANNKALAAFRLAEASGNEDVLIKKITLTNIGSARDGDLRNFKLINQGGSAAIKAQTAVGGKVDFIFEPGYLLRKNHYEDFTLKADIISGDGREIKFIINNQSDLTAVGKENGYGLATADDSAAPDNSNRFRIARTPIFLTLSQLKSNEQLIYRDQFDAVLGSFELRNNVSDLKLESFVLSIVKSSGAPALDQPLIAIDGQTETILGTVDAQKITNNFAEINLSNFQAAKGKTLKIKFKTHIPHTARSGDKYQILIKSVNYHIADDNLLYSDQVELLGQTLGVIKPAAYYYSGQPSKDDLAVAGAARVKLGFFKVEATAERDLRINSLTITNAAGFTPVNYGNGFSNLALYKGGYRVSDFLAEPNANSYTFENLNIYVGAGTSADLYVRADAAVNAAGKVKLVLENAVAEDYDSKIPGEVNNKNVASPEVALSQTVLEIKSLGGGQVIKGERTNQIASFSLTNKALEKVRINKVIINSSGFMGNLSNHNGFSNLRFGYLDNRGRVVSVGSWVKPVADVNEINLSGFTYDPGETFTINLYLDAAEDAVSGAISLFIRDIQAKGQISGVDAAVSGLPTDAVEVNVN